MNSEIVEETSYKLTGDFLANAATAHLLTSFKRCMALDHKLHPVVAAMYGMSGRKYRYLINNLIEVTGSARYLEVGSFYGSTVCAAIYGNRLTATCIDNWSAFGGTKDVFLGNVQAVKNDSTIFRCIESDFRKVDFTQIGYYDIYLFDGPHEEKDQYDGIVIAQPSLDDIYTLIVDDWNWPAVRKGTNAALTDAGNSVICSIEIRTTQNDTHPTLDCQKSEWHNGYFLAVCQKKS